MHRTWIAVLVLGALCTRVSAQQQFSGLATGSPRGIFVLLGTRIASRQMPAADAVGYRLERRKAGEVNWQALADIEAPSSLPEFSSRLEKACGLVPGHGPLPAPVAESLWRRAQDRRDIDSLGYWRTSVAMQLALGTRYLDASAERGVDYEYRVSELLTGNSIRPTFVSGRMHWPLSVDFAPVRLTTHFETDSSITLAWQAVGKTPACYLSVHRRTGLTGPFQEMTIGHCTPRGTDTAVFQFVDRQIDAAQVYQYYAVPSCAFGNTGAPSETTLVAAYSFRDIRLPDSIGTEGHDSLGGVRLTWRLREPGNLKSIRIYRSQEYDTGYVMIAELPPTDTDYADESAEEMQRYFYYLDMTGLLDEVSPKSVRVSCTYQSLAEPAAPYALLAEPLDRGVRLRWRSDGRVAGFYVYRGQGFGSELGQLSPLLPATGAESVYDDTSPGLSGYYQYAYAVRAESRSHVQGPLSETVYVRPGIPTKPAAPLGLSAEPQDRCVQLYWENMQTSVVGLNGYRALRREVLGQGSPGEFVRLNDSLVPAEQNSYADTTAEKGKWYEYAVQAVDAFGGVSAPSTAVRAGLRKAPLIPPAGVKALRTNGGIIVSWDETVQEDLVGHRLYRSTGSTEPSLVAALGPDEQQHFDKSVSKNGFYVYCVTSVGSDGRESERSEEVGIRF